MIIAGWITLAAAFAFMFGWADRFRGSSVSHRLGVAIRPGFIAFVVITCLLAMMSPWWALIGVAWAAWAFDGFNRFGGKIDPRTPKEMLGYFGRHLEALAFVPVAWFLGWGILVPVLATVAFALVAVALGRWLAWFADNKSPALIGTDVDVTGINDIVEYLRGVARGLSIFVVIWWATTHGAV